MYSVLHSISRHENMCINDPGEYVLGLYLGESEMRGFELTSFLDFEALKRREAPDVETSFFM